MSLHIAEPDWRHFKRLHDQLLERFCARTLEDLQTHLQSDQGTAHDRYLRAYKLVASRDEELARAFNDFRRSTAIVQLAIMLRMGLLEDAELSTFSADAQSQIRSIASLDH